MYQDNLARAWWRSFVVVAVVFTLGARLDLFVSGLFFADGQFPLAHSGFLEVVRQVIWVITLLVAVGCLIGWGLSFRFDVPGVPKRLWAIASGIFILGPGLLVNGFFKAYWGRARPSDVEAFGGVQDFSPALMSADECMRNCSFVSGEAAGAVALAVVAYLLTSSMQDATLKQRIRTGALVLAVVGASLRIMTGRHFLSDVLFAALVVTGVALLLLWLWPGAKRYYGGGVAKASAPSKPIPLKLVGESYTYDYAVVIPALNEADNIRSLAERIEAAMTGRSYELIVVDDGSTDGTGARLEGGPQHWRVIRHETSAGQSAAVHTGTLAARAPVIVTLDGDGQNPPEEIPKLLEIFEARAEDAALGLVAGQREKRIDTFAKRWASKFANGLRGWALNDGTRDTGCGLKAFRRDVFLSLPFFNHMHRYLPALANRAGYEVAHVDVAHAARESGASKYTNWQRGLVGAVDLLGVMWLIRRKKMASPEEINVKAGDAS